MVTSFVPDPESVPSDLRVRRQWVRWKGEQKPNGKLDKIPVHPSRPSCASSTDPLTWGSFETALANVGKDDTIGVGFVFSEDDPYVGIDFDHVLDEAGCLHPAVAPLVEDLGTYAEVSPSGRGVKLFGNRTERLPYGIAHKAAGPVGEIEVYDRARFFTVTGQLLPGAPEEIRPVNGALDRLLDRYFQKRKNPAEGLGEALPKVEELHDDDAAGLAMRLVARTVGAIARGAKRHDQVRSALAQARHNRIPWGIAERMLPALLDAANAVPGKEPYPAAQLERLLKWTWAHVTPGQPWESVRKTLEEYREDAEKDDLPPAVLDPVEILRREVYAGNRFPTRIGPLDELLGGGLAPSFAFAVAGAPGDGKTLLFTQLATELLRQGAAVVILAGDEDRVGLAQRIGQNLGFEKDELSPLYPNVLDRLAAALADRKILVFPDPERPVTVEEAEEALVELAPEGALRVLLVDSLQTVKCRASEPDDGETVAVTKVVEALRGVKKRTGAVILATSEANRASYASKDPNARIRPIASFAGSRTPEFRFDVPMSISSEGDDRVRLEIVKNRLGHRKGVIALKLDRLRARWLPIDIGEIEREKEETAQRQKVERDEQRRAERRDAVLDAMRAAKDPEAGVSLARLRSGWRGKVAELRPTLDVMVEEGVIEEIPGPPGARGGPRPTHYRLRRKGA